MIHQGDQFSCSVQMEEVHLQRIVSEDLQGRPLLGPKRTFSAENVFLQGNEWLYSYSFKYMPFMWRKQAARHQKMISKTTNAKVPQRLEWKIV